MGDIVLIKTRLAGTDLDISPVGLGTVKIGRDQGVKYPNGFTIPDDRQVTDLLALCRDLGINLIDTAPAYGTSETRLGPLLRGQRDHWVICSKAGEEFDNTTGESAYIFTPEHIRSSVERSLRRLETDYIDILLIHSDGNDMQIINEFGALDVLNDLKAEGKIRAGGMSGKTVEGGIETLKRSDCAMVTYNLNQPDEAPVLDYAHQHHKGILIKKALASGHLCLNEGEDPVQASFNFIFRHPGVHSAIVGTINPDHLQKNVAAVKRAIETMV
ncbi:aldo/keto reductase [Aliamphritea spongicola]|uniref:aldo/keto reductase n=1 Tax=Aliamphritea spongicola TaxID=707589 RepID=UPI00196BA69B|nr:aldo/keto reductase [Aliamphritea spongicola]MBN3562415.1 aldo/keto reductase [Aliamphritea spongicola]